MSTISTKFSLYALVLAELLFLFSSASAQAAIQINVKIDAASSTPTAFIAGENAIEMSDNWSFLNSYAGAENLGERISDFNLSERGGRKISIRKLAAGEFLANGKADLWSYKIDLSAPQNANATAHVSWLNGERGILMLGDLLPQFSTSGKQNISALVKFDLPKDWSIISRETKTGENTFAVENINKAIFFVGKNWRAQETQVGKGKLNLAVSGEWKFSDDEAKEIAREIWGEYEKIFGEDASENIQIAIAHFPQTGVKSGRWTAETRGANTLIVSSDMPFKAQALQRLHEQLRHELFHLWIPNRMALTGDYDWFYEGFAIYESLKIGVALNRIRFEDFLDTLAQSYDLENAQTQKFSLIEQSKNRWSGSQIYARGLLVAFLCDVALLRQSKSRRSVTNFVQEIYQKYHFPNKTQDGNAAILETLKNHTELKSVVEKYIEGAEKIDWQTDLETIGVEQTEENSFAHLKVKAKLSGRQKDLLNELGYNNWRKISEKQK